MRWGTDYVGVPPMESAIVCRREGSRRISADNSNRFAPGVDSRVRAARFPLQRRRRPKFLGIIWIVRVYCVAGRAVIVSGACGALALEPIAFGPAMAIPLTVAVWLIDGSADSPGRAGAASQRSAARAGWRSE